MKSNRNLREFDQCRTAGVTAKPVVSWRGTKIMAINGKPKVVSICPGPIKRREFLRVGLSGFASLSLPGLFRLRAQAATETPNN
ncbi:MAG: hypothetical protein L0Z50_09170, partial [Verrucomicrobiales bacterium]|nr:hypothetical protein [Verrucomicrobiales bacterium]